MDAMDLIFIATSLYPSIERSIQEKMIAFNSQVYHDTMITCSYGRKGNPWEFNLRDILRWCELLKTHSHTSPKDFVDVLYLQRMRTEIDRQRMLEVFVEIFGDDLSPEVNSFWHITPSTLQVNYNKNIYISNTNR
jgi:midasin